MSERERQNWVDTWEPDLRAAWEQAEKDRKAAEKEVVKRTKQAAEDRNAERRAERSKSNLRRQR